MLDPLNPRLKEFLTSDDFGLKKQQTRKLRNDKEVASKLYKKNREQSLGNADDPGTRRQHLFQPPDAANVSKANEKQITNGAVKLKKGASGTLDSGDLVTKENRKATLHGKESALSSTVVRSRTKVQTAKESKRQKVSEKYTDEEMRRIEAQMSSSDEEVFPSAPGEYGIHGERESEGRNKEEEKSWTTADKEKQNNEQMIENNLEEGEIADDE